MPDFLLEIGTEEIPARMIDAASVELRERVNKLLERERLPASGPISYLDTPRRLAFLATNIPAAQPDVTEQVNGPAVSVAFKDGKPGPAAEAFAKKAGVEISQLERVTTPKGEYLSAKITTRGRSAAEILAESLPREIASIYWPKNMYWSKPSERRDFARKRSEEHTSELQSRFDLVCRLLLEKKKKKKKKYNEA